MVTPVVWEPSHESKRAGVAGPRAAGAKELVELWRNPLLPESTLDVPRQCLITGVVRPRVVDSFSVQFDTGIVGFEFPLLQLSTTSGFAENISRTNPGFDFSVTIWEEDPGIDRQCFLGANNGEVCRRGNEAHLR